MGRVYLNSWAIASVNCGTFIHQPPKTLGFIQEKGNSHFTLLYAILKNKHIMTIYYHNYQREGIQMDYNLENFCIPTHEAKYTGNLNAGQGWRRKGSSYAKQTNRGKNNGSKTPTKTRMMNQEIFTSP